MEQFLVFLLFLSILLLQLLARVVKSRRGSGPERTTSRDDVEAESAWPAPVEPQAPPAPHAAAPPYPFFHAPPPAPVAISRPAPPRAAPRAAVRSKDPMGLRLALRDKAGLERAVALMAILGPPRALDSPEEK